MTAMNLTQLIERFPVLNSHPWSRDTVNPSHYQNHCRLSLTEALDIYDIWMNGFGAQIGLQKTVYETALEENVWHWKIIPMTSYEVKHNQGHPHATNSTFLFSNMSTTGLMKCSLLRGRPLRLKWIFVHSIVWNRN